MTLLGILIIALFVVLTIFLFRESLRMTTRQMLLVVVCLVVLILIVLMVNDNPMTIR